jgi:hypothetical protein
VNVKNEMTLAWEEIFGLVLSVIAYDSEEEAIAIANDSKAGRVVNNGMTDDPRLPGWIEILRRRPRISLVRDRGVSRTPHIPEA